MYGSATNGPGEAPRKNRVSQAGGSRIEINEPELGGYQLTMEGLPQLLFTENETNTKALWNWEGHPGAPPYVKDAFHQRVIHGREDAVNPAQRGTKACAWYKFNLAAGQTQTIRLRLTLRTEASRLIHDIDGVFAERMAEAEEFYSFANPTLSPDGKRVQRQALAGLLWSRQYYHFVVADWFKGDPGQPKPPGSRLKGRDSNWVHIYNEDVLTMPDKWEYPWYAAWDLAFHMIPLALVDPDNAKPQLKLFLREWYMHPNGQIPAYEWAFGDVNPPVHAWACWRVFTRSTASSPASADYAVSRNRIPQTADELHLVGESQGLGRQQHFRRRIPGPRQHRRVRPLEAFAQAADMIEQSDGTSWMAMYCLNMLRIALELAVKADPLYEDIANKFFEHFLYIAHAMNGMGGKGLWDEEDGFFYDCLSLPDGQSMPMRVRSVVGMIPLFAVDTMESGLDRIVAGIREPHELVHRATGRICARICASDAPGHGASGGC